jgi:hypothetical protein
MRGVSTGRRITLTVAAGVFLGLATLVVEDPGFPTAGVNTAIDSLLAIVAAIVLLGAPLVVARWWVVLSMVGPALALLLMQAANVQVTLDDGTGPAINYRTIFQFAVLCAVMLVVVSAYTFFVPPQSDQPG